MKYNQFLLILVFGVSFYGALSQCPSGDMAFSEQNQLDSFAINYPDCQSFDHLIFINGSVNNLNGLSKLKRINNLTITGCDSINTLQGLENLEAVSRLMIVGCKGLKDLVGLSQLKKVEVLSLGFNPNFINPVGLSSIDTIEIWQSYGNHAMESFEGLESVKYLDQMSISDSIVEFEGLPVLDSITFLSLISTDSINSFNDITQYFNKVQSFNASNIAFTTEGISDFDIIDEISFSNMKELVFTDQDEPMNISLSSIGLTKCQNITGIDNLDTYNSQSLSVVECHTLNDIERLPQSLSSIAIYSCNSLSRLGGEMSDVIEINLWNNPLLGDISSVENIEDLESIYIEACPLLEFCSYSPICDLLLSSDSDAIITDNGVGCSDSLEVLSRCSSAVDGTKDLKIAIYPNPASDLLHISGLLDLVCSEIQIIDMYGRHICSHAINHRNQEFYIGEMLSGSYLYRIVNKGDIVQIGRFTKI